MLVMTVRDAKAQLFGRPFFVQSQAHAIRAFERDINAKPQGDAINDFFTHPDDFELFELGEYDDTDGSFALHKQPKPVIQASQLKLAA